MKLLPLFLIFVSAAVFAKEDCVFDDTAYRKFINQYSTGNKNSTIGPDGKTLLVNRKDEHIIVTGGGCNHLGVAIELTSKQAYNEQQFLQKTQDLAVEFGDWLINTKALKASIANDNYRVIDGTYYIEVDVMTVFEASYDRKGKISVDFYIN